MLIKMEALASSCDNLNKVETTAGNDKPHDAISYEETFSWPVRFAHLAYIAILAKVIKMGNI